MRFKLLIVTGVVLVVLLAACSGAGPSADPSPGDGIPSADPPSAGHEAPGLERVLPMAVGGLDYARRSFAGEQPFRARRDRASAARLVTLMCRDRATVAIAEIVGSPRPWSVTAYYVAASNGPELRAAIVDEIFGVLVPGDATPVTIRTEVHAGRPVLLDGPWPTDGPLHFAYETGDLLFAFEGVPSATWAEEYLALLPGPEVDTSIYAPPDSVSVACGASDDPELLALLPRRLADIAMHPLAPGTGDLRTGGPDSAGARFLDLTGATDETFSGYLLYANIGSVIAAFRVRGADASALEQGCAALLESDIARMERRTAGGKALLLVTQQIGTSRVVEAGCYVRGDTLFWGGGGQGIMDYFDAIP